VEVGLEPGVSALFAPRSIAIVGATGKPGSLFARPVSYLTDYGFPGAVYPVNPKYEEISGHRCYPSLAAIEEKVDLVLVMVPAAFVEEVVTECGEIGAAVAIVFSSGFAETGREGAERQRRLGEIARQGGVRIVGPNCQGVIVPSGRLAATFTGSIAHALPEPSGLAYVGQSGAVGGCVLDLAADYGVGISAWLSLGNQADVNIFEAALEVAEMPEVRVIAAYVESVESGEDYQRLAARCAELEKSLVLLRAARTEPGRRAAVHHTGGLRPPDAAFDAIARRHGAVLVDDIDALVDVSCALLRFGGRHGERVAVVTSSGGAGGIAADHLTLSGLAVPELPESAQAELAEVVPDFGSVVNPVDVTFQLFAGGSSGFTGVCEQLAGLDEIDQVVTVMSAIGGEASTEVAVGLAATVDAVDKPIHYGYVVGHAQTAGARQALREARLPAYASLGRVATVAKALSRSPRLVGLPPEPAPDPRFAGLPVGRLTDEACRDLLAAFSVPQSPGGAATMGLELMVTVTRERPDFPPLLSVGLSGEVGEALAETVAECLPLDAADVERMLRSLSGAALLDGVRGGPAVDLAAAVDAILAIGDAGWALGERLAELAVDPLTILPVGQGALAIGAVARLGNRIDKEN
jgi:acyl-CoA synthetase (NDP forming)